MAVAELSGDRLNIVPGSQRVITPSDGTFREGTCVIFRKGKYYFLWSEDDTRSENYRVRYGIAESPVNSFSGIKSDPGERSRKRNLWDRA